MEFIREGVNNNFRIRRGFDIRNKRLEDEKRRNDRSKSSSVESLKDEQRPEKEKIIFNSVENFNKPRSTVNVALNNYNQNRLEFL